MAEYLINDTTGALIPFSNNLGSIYFQTPWRDATQPEIDAFLLANAKIVKVEELDQAKINFCDAGLLYSGDTFSLSDNSTQNMVLKNNVLGYESNSVSVLAATKSYNLPQGHGLGFNPGQTVYVLGFTDAANNGAKTVDHLEDNYLLVTDTLADEAAGDDISISNDERYKYYDVDEVQVDFSDGAGWNDFFAAMMNEKDRIMRYYCTTKKQIADCTTVAQVDAITIDFAA